MISYAGLALRTPTPDVRAWIADNVALDVDEFGMPLWPGPRLLGHSYRPSFPPGPVVLDRLYWPSGAARFACFHGLVTDATLEKLRPLGGAAALVIGDGTRSITTSLYSLPARPLSQIAGDNGLHLLTLVDDRWHWWFRSAQLTVVEGTTTWAQLYASIGAALGVTIAAEGVNAAYLKPPASVAPPNEALPIILDTVAASVGHRIVRELSGTVRAMSATTSQQRVNFNLLRRDPVQAGGLFSLTP